MKKMCVTAVYFCTFSIITSLSLNAADISLRLPAAASPPPLLPTLPLARYTSDASHDSTRSSSSATGSFGRRSGATLASLARSAMEGAAAAITFLPPPGKAVRLTAIGARSPGTASPVPDADVLRAIAAVMTPEPMIAPSLARTLSLPQQTKPTSAPEVVAAAHPPVLGGCGGAAGHASLPPLEARPTSRSLSAPTGDTDKKAPKATLKGFLEE